MVLIGCLANALPYSSRMALQESVLQDSSLGTTHCVPTLCLPDVTTHDQISLVFLLCICRETADNGLEWSLKKRLKQLLEVGYSL